MNRLILAGVAVLGCLTVACAETAGSPALDNRSAAWKQKLAQAVNDASKVESIILSMPDADRAGFAADVLTVLQAKRQFMADKVAWAKEFGVTAAALVSGAGGAKSAVLAAVTAGIGNACITGESRELGKGDMALLGVLVKSTEMQLKGDDRVAFANALLGAVGKQKAADAGVHKLALSMTALSLFAGAGDAKKTVAAEIFAVVDVGDLGAVSEALCDAFNQRKNSITNDDYLQVALQILQVVAPRVAGMPDAVTRFAYAVAAFMAAAGNPAQFEHDLMGKLDDLLGKVGATRESLATALAAAKADMAVNADLVQTLYPELSRKNAWGVVILPPGNLLMGWEGIPFVGLNRPPPGGYQNQGIGP